MVFGFKCVTHGRRSINTATFLGLDEEIGECRNKWQTVTNQQVFPFDPSQTFYIVFVEERQMDITSHSKRPQGISGHEPVRRR